MVEAVISRIRDFRCRWGDNGFSDNDVDDDDEV